jgi:ACS family glucarate transporter-like MFS transporter
MVGWGWRAALLISALPALAVALVWLAIGEPEGLRGAGKAETARGLPRSTSFILLTISYTLQGYVGYIFVFWFYLYLVEVRHFDLLRGALFGALPWILSIVSIPLGGWISDRLAGGRRIVPFAGLAGSSVFLALGAHTANAYLAAVCLAVSTALVLSVEGLFWATMIRIAGPRSGAAGGVMNMGSNLGGLISPALTPVLAASIGWENALLVAAALAAVAGVLWVGISPRPEDGAA